MWLYATFIRFIDLTATNSYKQGHPICSALNQEAKVALPRHQNNQHNKLPSRVDLEDCCEVLQSLISTCSIVWSIRDQNISSIWQQIQEYDYSRIITINKKTAFPPCLTSCIKKWICQNNLPPATEEKNSCIAQPRNTEPVPPKSSKSRTYWISCSWVEIHILLKKKDVWRTFIWSLQEIS